MKQNISYDVLEMSGSRAVWSEVLAVYAVKTTTDPDNAQEVASMDNSKKTILKDIFWQMNEISSRTDTSTETVIAPKFRRKVFYREKRAAIGKILQQLCEWKGVKVIAAEACPDHIHLFVEIPPKFSVSSLKKMRWENN